jgi:hypothetical protein
VLNLLSTPRIVVALSVCMKMVPEPGLMRSCGLTTGTVENIKICDEKDVD